MAAIDRVEGAGVMVINYCCACDGEFWARGIAQKTCSLECARELRDEIFRERESVRIDREMFGIENCRKPIRSPEDALELMRKRKGRIALIEANFAPEQLIKDIRALPNGREILSAVRGKQKYLE